MNEFFLGILEITAGMSLLILVMVLGLKLIGAKFTAKCRYILWTLVMIRLVVPFSFGILPALIEVPVETEPVQIQVQVPTVEYSPVPQNPVTAQPQEPVQMPSPPVQTPVYTEPKPEPITWEDVKAYIPHIYLIGTAIFLLWNLLSYWIYTAKILRTARETDAETQEIYAAVCRKKGLSHPPVLLVSQKVNSPAAFGLIRRRIVLPDIELTENGLVGTLSHEVTHCKRGDLWIKLVCLLARSLHWFNPLVHLAAFRCEMEMELSCDEAVLAGCSEETRAAYGEVMLDIIRRCRRNQGALTTHFNPKKNAVKARFANIMNGSGKRKGLWLIAVCLVLCLIAGAVVACRTETEFEEETEADNTGMSEETVSENSGSAAYLTMEAYVNDCMAQESTITYYSVSRHNANPDGGADEWTAAANVVDTKLVMFEKKGELAGLSPDGVLECWRYKYLLKLDVPAEEVILVGGQDREDDWLDLEGQNGHTVVALQRPDGTYTILMDEMTGDGLDFTGYRNSCEEAIYDWYVTEYDLALPLYVEEWGDLITPPEGERIGNTPVHRFDGDGWGIYIPVQAWYSSTDAMENQWLWRSSYNTGSTLMVDEFSHSLEDEYVTAEKQGYTPADSTKRVWGNHTDGLHSCYYYYEKPNGGFWRVTIEWTDEGITDYSYIAIEPQVLRLMAEKFVVFGTDETVEEYQTEELDGGNIAPIITPFQEDKITDNKLQNKTLEKIIEDNKAAITEEIYSIIREAEKVRYDIREPELEIVSITEDRADCIFWSDWEWSRKAEEDPMILGMYEAMEALTDAQEIEYANDIIQGWIPEIESWYITERIEQRVVIKQNNGSWTLYYPHVENGEETLFDLAEYAAEHWTEDSEARKQGGADIINDAMKLYREMEKTVSTVNPDTIWQTFLDTVVSPYSEYVVSHEFLDLDGNGIDELLIYDWGASANCGIEIFTIENGEVRSFSIGTNGITHYSEEAKSLASPSANANAYSFWGLPTSYADRSDTVLWFVPCDYRKRNGYVLYSMNGSDVYTSEDYYYFTSDENGNLTVEVLRSFRCEAIDSNPANGWKCYINGEEVNVRWFRDTMGFFWQDLSVSHGVQYHDKNTASRYDELESWVEDHSEEILQPEEEVPEGIVFVDENSEPYTYTREEWIQYSLYSDFGFRDPVDVSALTDDELTIYMVDAYQCAVDIYFLFEVCSDRMYARNLWNSTMPQVEIDGRYYSQMFNPVFPALAALESYMNGVLSEELTKQLLSYGMFIDYEGELWGMMGARGTDISKKTIDIFATVKLPSFHRVFG